MAIERTNLYDDTSVDNTFDNLYNYLLENAVPEYFDSVAKSEDDDYIICTVNGREFVKFPKSLGYIYITLANNTVLEKGDRSGSYGRAVKLKNGIFLGAYHSSYAKYFRPLFAICKDNENNTTLVFDGNKFCDNSSGDYHVASINANTITKDCPYVEILKNSLSENITGKTVLCPIVVGDTANYTPNVFYMPYAQNRSEGVLCIDGVKYYSNGIWCVKDE